MDTNIGEYWSNSNKEFEQSDPILFQRILRNINPLTSFGSNIGSMYDASNKGDVIGMGLSTLASIPLFGAVRSIKTLDKTLQFNTKIVPNWGKFSAQALKDFSANGANDGYDALKE